MLKMDWSKIDKFYLFFSGLLIVLAVVLIVTFRMVFSSFLTAYDTTEKSGAGQVVINEDDVEEAYQFAYDDESMEN